jgi:5-oxoprolinase (ATP-hydrolysing)
MLTPQPEVLYSKVVQVDERVAPVWSEFLEEGKTVADNGDKLVKTASGVVIQELKALGEHITTSAAHSV